MTKIIQNMTQKDKDEMLIAAVQEDRLDNVKQSLELGADPDVRGVSNNTPLIIASGSGYTKIVRLLLKHGAKVNAVNKFSATPLDYASHRHYPDIVKILIKMGADVNIQDVQGNTPLIYAAYNGKTDVMDVLIKAGADTGIKNSSGKTAPDILKDKYPEKYNLWRLRRVLKQEDSPSITGSYNEPDFDI